MAQDKSSPPEQPLHPASPPAAGDVYEIPVEGSLGLLALGATGLRLWRAKRDAAKQAQTMQGEKEQ